MSLKREGDTGEEEVKPGRFWGRIWADDEDLHRGMSKEAANQFLENLPKSPQGALLRKLLQDNDASKKQPNGYKGDPW